MTDEQHGQSERHGPTGGLGIGEVADRTGLTHRTLRYYEELGLIAPGRDGGGRRVYGHDELERLARVRLQRALGTPLAEVRSGDDGGGPDLLALTRRQLAALDALLARTARDRERVRAVEARLLDEQRPADEALVDLLAGLTSTSGDEPVATRRLTLLVCRDLEAEHRHLVEVFGFSPGPLTRDGDGRVVHGEVVAGDGVVWLHPELDRYHLAAPRTLSASTACLAVAVDDADAHHHRLVAAGAAVVAPPGDMPYGVREWSARDLEGHLWSFQQPLPEGPTGA